MTGRSIRAWQLCLVLTVGFFFPIMNSLRVFLGWLKPQPATQSRFLLRISFQLLGIICLYVVLRCQGRGLGDIGFTGAIRLNELAHSFMLFFGAILSSAVAYLFVMSIYALVGHAIPQPDNSAALFGTTMSIFPLLYVLINPFHEELLVRAFLITETEWIFRNTLLGIIFSVVLQTSYHLYQGLPGAVSHVTAFLLFSFYFVRKRRILPVILAHLYMDVSAFAIHFRYLHPATHHGTAALQDALLRVSRCA